MSEQPVPEQAPTVQQPVVTPPVASQPVPEAAPSYVAPPVAEQAKQGTYVPRWVAVVAAAVVIGIGGFAVGKATSDDTSNSRPAGFSQQGGQQPGGFGQGQQGGFGQGQQGGQQQGGSTQGGFGQGQQQGGSTQGGVGQGGFGQNGPMTRSGGS